MDLHKALTTVPPMLLAAAIVLAGCSKEPSAEQKKADADFASAKSAFLAGEYRSAKTLLSSLLPTEERLSRTARIGELLHLLGNTYAATASCDSAIQTYTRAIEIYRSLADRQTARDLTLQAASIHSSMGETRKAYALCTEALRLARVFNDEGGIRDVLWAMLPLSRSLDEHVEETRMLSELLKDYTADKDVAKQSKVYFESGLADFARHNDDLAVKDFGQAVLLADQIHDSVFAATSMLRVAMSYEAAGNANGAIQRYADALKRVEKLRGCSALRFEMLTRVGNLYLRNSQLAEAKRFYRAAIPAAINAGNLVGEGYLYVQLGHCDLESARETALKSYSAALDMFKSYNWGPGISYAQLGIAEAQRRNGQITEAIESMKSAIAQSEQVLAPRNIDDLYAECESAFFGSLRYPAYGELADILLGAGRSEEAFWYIERENNRGLLWFLSRLDPVPHDPSFGPVLAEFQHLRALRIGAEQKYTALLTTAPRQKEVMEDVRRYLDRQGELCMDKADAVVEKDSAFASWVGINSIGLPEVQKRLDEGTALVQYFAGSRSLYALVITNTKTSVEIAATERNRLSAAAEEFNGLLKHQAVLAESLKTQILPPDRRLQELGRYLSEAFVRPISGDIRGMQKVLIVLPAGIPWVPVHALRTTPSPLSPYLAQSVLVSYLPSARSLLTPGTQPGPVHDIVGVGFPGGTAWDVEYELRDIRAFYKDTRLYFNQQATMNTVQNEHCDVLHLTVECEYTHRAPGNAYLVFSDGESPTGSRDVPFGQLFSLPPFPAIVLSNIAADVDGVDPALPWIFLANGSSAVITNALVPSRQTKWFLCEAFYTALLAGKSPQEAFRQVQLSMVKDPEFAAPFVWGPFFLWGK